MKKIEHPSKSDIAHYKTINANTKDPDDIEEDFDYDNSMYYLMDTNILYCMFCHIHDPTIFTKLRKHSGTRKIRLCIIGKINNEFQYLANKPDEDCDGIPNDEKLVEFKKKLRALGQSNYLKSGKHSNIWAWAEKFSKNKKKQYLNKKGIGLSVPDCLLLKYYLENQKYELITHDGPLKTAAKEEGGKFSRPEMIFDPISSSTNTNQ